MKVMLEEHTRKDIEKHSLEVLKGCKGLDVFPTPVDSIVEYTELAIATGIDLSSVNESFFSNFSSDLLRSGLSKIRGILDRSHKIIYLDLSQKTSRQGFVKLHEVGHEILPWQKKSLAYLDDDNTLGEDINEDFEAEANYFASITLFQHDRFLNQASKLELGINAPLYLAKHFGSSAHAALRRYVECSKKRCALLVLENCTHKPLQASCDLRNYFQSPKFDKEFGQLTFPLKFGYKWPFVQHYYFNRKMQSGEITMPTKNGDVQFNYEFFNNTYNAFVLIFPKGENKKTRTKIIIKEQ